MVYVGVDLGKIGDPSALAVVERSDRMRAWQEPLYRGVEVRYLERIALGTPYTAVVERLRAVLRHPLLSGGSHMTVDATGVGVPVIDMLRAARLPCGITAVTIGSGAQAHGRGEWWHVPKRDLLSGLQLLLEHKELRIAKKLREAGALTRELIHMRMTQQPGGIPAAGAAGAEHDDLVIALAMACWQAMRPQNGLSTQRLPGI